MHQFLNSGVIAPKLLFLKYPFAFLPAAIIGCIVLFTPNARAQGPMSSPSGDDCSTSLTSPATHFSGQAPERNQSVVFRKPSYLRADAVNLHLPRLGKGKSRHFTLKNFIVSPGVEGNVPQNWLNGTSRIRIINLLFDTAYRLKLFKRS